MTALDNARAALNEDFQPGQWRLREAMTALIAEHERLRASHDFMARELQRRTC